MEEFTENALSFGHCPNNPPPFPLRASWANLSILEKVLNQNRSKSIWAAPPPSPCMPIWATFAFSFTKVSESVWAGGPPNMGNAQKKECFFSGTSSFSKWANFLGINTDLLHLPWTPPLFGGHPVSQSPLFLQMAGISIFSVKSYVWTWTRVFFCGEMNKVLLCNTMKSNSLSNKPQQDPFGWRQHWDEMHSSCDPDNTKFMRAVVLPNPSPQTWF